MKRLRRFLGLRLDEERLRDREAVARLGVRCRWIPEEIQPFDELEFALPLSKEEEAVFTCALEEGRFARMLLGRAAAGDDDADTRGFDDEAIREVLDRHGATLERLLTHLTGGGPEV